MNMKKFFRGMPDLWLCIVILGPIVAVLAVSAIVPQPAPLERHFFVGFAAMTKAEGRLEGFRVVVVRDNKAWNGEDFIDMANLIEPSVTNLVGHVVITSVTELRPPHVSKLRPKQ